MSSHSSFDGEFNQTGNSPLYLQEEEKDEDNCTHQDDHNGLNGLRFHICPQHPVKGEGNEEEKKNPICMPSP